MARFTTIEQVHDYLNRIPMFQDRGVAAARFGLEGITRLLEGMGNPHREIRTIHVAGTNGKGSVCHLLHAVYSGAGYRTGMYTSPHLSEYNERFVIDGNRLSDSDLIYFFDRYAGHIDACNPTYFEISTALAFWYFHHKKTDIAIIETGLGGRLDATNVITPLTSVITSIGLDHTDLLGNTPALIAAEKAGIIKPEVPVVTGRIGYEAMQVITKKAVECGSQLLASCEPEPLWDNGKIGLHSESGTVWLETDFFQPVQRYNTAAAGAVVTVNKPILPVSDEQFRQGVKKASESGGLPARFQRLIPGEDIFYDGAHNPEAFAETVRLLSSIASGKKKILVFSMMRDKLSPEMLSMVLEFDELYYLESNLNRAALFQEVSALVPKLKRFNEESWVFYQKLFTSESAVILFSGSLYFYRRVLDMIQHTKKTSSPVS